MPSCWVNCKASAPNATSGSLLIKPVDIAQMSGSMVIRSILPTLRTSRDPTRRRAEGKGITASVPLVPQGPGGRVKKAIPENRRRGSARKMLKCTIGLGGQFAKEIGVRFCGLTGTH